MPSNTYPRHRKLDLWRLHVFPKIPLWSVAKRAIHSFRPFMHVPYTLWVWSNFYQIVKTISEHFNTEEVLSNCVSAQPCSNLSTIWTVAHQVPLPKEFSRQEYWSGLLSFLLQEFSQLRDWTCISCVSYISRQILYHSRNLGSSLIHIPWEIKVEKCVLLMLQTANSNNFSG